MLISGFFIMIMPLIIFLIYLSLLGFDDNHDELMQKLEEINQNLIIAIQGEK